MTALQTFETNAYDVLGVSPDASAWEIDEAFHRLIEEGGYRSGVPLRDQWQRAREIKEAYATLRDARERRPHDESLEGVWERPLWPAARHDHPADAALVQPLSEGEPPPGLTSVPTTGPVGSSNGEPEDAPAGASESGSDEIAPSVDQPMTSQEDDASGDEFKYDSAKRWGGAAAATLALGSVLYFTWPSGSPQVPDTEMAAQRPAGAQQVNSGAPVAGQSANLPPAAAPGDTPPLPEGLGAFFQPPGAAKTDVPGAAPAEVAVANATQTGPNAAATSVGNTASATASAPAPVSSGQTSTATGATATAAPALAAPGPQAHSVVPPAQEAAPAQVRASVAVPPATGAISSPPQLISGGPTHLDNRRGRYVGSVVVQFTVQADGRVSNCGPARSSGKADLDAFTCRLVEERMRFKPALDAQGNPVASSAHARYEWGRRRRHPSLLSWIFR